MLLLLDSASLYYRSYFALPESMTAPDGFPNNAVRGFLTTITKLIDRFEPTGLAACWDQDWRPAWRVQLVPSYKTHRVAQGSALIGDGSPDDGSSSDGSGLDAAAEAEPVTLGPQVNAIADLLDAMGVARPGAAEHEADDVIATLAAGSPGPTVVVTGDRDLVQVVRHQPQVSVLLAVNGGMDKWPLLSPADVHQRFGVAPERYVDFAVLRGDPSDGLPGVRGIGAKTAAALVDAYPSLDALLAAAAEAALERPLTARIAQALLDHADEIQAAQIVATAVTDLPLGLSMDDLAVPATAADAAALAALADQWGVRRFVPDLAALAGR